MIYNVTIAEHVCVSARTWNEARAKALRTPRDVDRCDVTDDAATEERRRAEQGGAK